MDFKSIIGYRAIKLEVSRILDQLTNPDKYLALGVTEPHGLLFHGVPGVGKSTFANAVLEASGRMAFVCRKDKSNGDFVNEIVDVFNNVLGKNYKGFQRGYSHFKDNQYAWFPKLAMEGKSVVRGWNNQLTEDGSTIYEFNDANKELNEQRKKENKYVGEERIVFTQTKNPITGNREYRFAGIFKCTEYDNQNRTVYRKTSDEIKIY